ncbi:phage holin family protein [Alicyclobacillus dauci]|uniref:Phage holin family protein n=1 Tax=Alicyclobacillus dauci TaxID=1475485 RepID=A0ABY6Z6X2_9BACL|nr:phage holin family protein [Alicyclobacillus dauci]WAH38626.1 phage holin family protein [Alicyclobacillus dauci]
MWNFARLDSAFCLVCAVIGTWISQLYGGWNASLSVLVWLVAGDYATGLIASALDGTGLSSKVGFRGIAKKVMILFLVLVAHELDVALGVNALMNLVIYFYVTNELISLTENLGRMGVPVPRQLVNIVCVLKGKPNRKD